MVISTALDTKFDMHVSSSRDRFHNCYQRTVSPSRRSTSEEMRNLETLLLTSLLLTVSTRTIASTTMLVFLLQIYPGILLLLLSSVVVTFLLVQ